jgi:hypothetical protein
LTDDQAASCRAGRCAGEVPGQQFLDAVDRMFGETFEHVTQVRLDVEAVELRGAEQAVAIPDRAKVVALLDADELREADLRERDVLGEGADQALVKLLLHRLRTFFGNTGQWSAPCPALPFVNSPFPAAARKAVTISSTRRMVPDIVQAPSQSSRPLL